MFFEEKIFNLKSFANKYGLKDETRKEICFPRIKNIEVYPRDFKKYTEKVFLYFDNGNTGGTRWICFYVKGNAFSHFDSFGGIRDKYLLQKLAKTIRFHEQKFQSNISSFCRTIC